MGKAINIGVATEFPIYTTTTETKNVDITHDNITTCFDVMHNTYGFVLGSGGTFKTSNGGVNDSTARTWLTALYDMTISFTYSYSSESNYDKLYLYVNGTTVENGVSGPTTTKSYSGTLPKGKQIEIVYTKDSSANKNDDECTFSNMKVSYTISNTFQSGTDIREVARLGKKLFIGDTSGKARKVKKVWIGDVNNKARLCYSKAAELKYVGTNTEWMPDSSVALPVGEYGVFFSERSYTGTSTIYALDASLTRTLSSLGSSSYDAKSCMAACSLGDLIIAAGGHWDTGSGYPGQSQIYTINSSLTSSKVSSYGPSRTQAGGTALNDGLVFAGGSKYYDSTDTKDSWVGHISRTGTMTNWPALPYKASSKTGVTFNNHAIFVGGYNYNDSDNIVNSVTAYDSSGTKKILSGPSTSRYSDTSAAYNSTYLIVAGGTSGTSSSMSNAVDAYNKSLTKVSGVPGLTMARRCMAHISTSQYAIFFGGDCNTVIKDRGMIVDMYDEALTLKRGPDMIPDTNLVGTFIGTSNLIAISRTNRSTSSCSQIFQYND